MDIIKKEVKETKDIFKKIKEIIKEAVIINYIEEKIKIDVRYIYEKEGK